MKPFNYATKLAPLVIGLSLYSSAYAAATLDDVVKAIDTFRTYVETKVKEGAETVQKLLFTETFNKEQTVTANIGQSTATNKVDQDLKELSLAQVKIDLTDSTNQMRQELLKIPASDVVTNEKTTVSFAGAQKQKDYSVNDIFFDVESLFGTDAYKEQADMDKARTFIRFLAIASQPTMVDFTGVDFERYSRKIAEIQTSEQYQAYRINTRNLTALNSIAVNNLYQLYAIRLEQKGLGEQLDMTDFETGKKIRDASALQVRDYLAQRRSRNPKWYDDLEEASPATVLREMAILLAEMRDELNETRKDYERLLLSISAMQITNNAALSKAQAAAAQNITEQIQQYKRFSN